MENISFVTARNRLTVTIENMEKETLHMLPLLFVCTATQGGTLQLSKSEDGKNALLVFTGLKKEGYGKLCMLLSQSFFAEGAEAQDLSFVVPRKKQKKEALAGVPDFISSVHDADSLRKSMENINRFVAMDKKKENIIKEQVLFCISEAGKMALNPRAVMIELRDLPASADLLLQLAKQKGMMVKNLQPLEGMQAVEALRRTTDAEAVLAVETLRKKLQ